MLKQDRYGRLCNRIFGISKAIVVVAVVLGEQQVVYKASPSFHVPEEKDRIKHMLKQSFIMVNEPSTNEDFFGKVRYVMVHHDMFDVYLFRIQSDPSKLLSVVLTPRDYDQIEFVEAVTYELLTI